MSKKKAFLTFISLCSLGLTGCQENEPEASHNLQTVPEVEATCLLDGMKKHQICLDEGCDGLLFDEDGNRASASSLVIRALGHDFQDDTECRYPVSEPTCTQGAGYHQACVRCGQEGTGLFFLSEGNGHRFSKDFISPVEDGEKENRNGFSYPLEYLASFTCQDCGVNKKQIKKGTFQIDTKEGCLSEGKAHVEVSFDEAYGGAYRKEFSLPPTGHEVEDSYSSDATKHWKACKNCKDKIGEESHSLSFINTEAKGHFKRCSVCSKEVELEEHSFQNPVVVCLSESQKRFKSTISCACGYSESEEKTGEIVVQKEPTCVEEGKAFVTCQFSDAFGGAFNDSLVLAPKGHVSDNVYEHDVLTHFSHCSVCGEKMGSEAHSVSRWNVVSYPSEETLGQRNGTCDICHATVDNSFSYCAKHEGLFYPSLEPTKVTAGYLGFYYCEACHKTILESEHVEGDGTWEESQELAKVESGNKQYLPATLTKGDVEAAVTKLNSYLGPDDSPMGLMGLQETKKARKYFDLYCDKVGKENCDIDVSNLIGAENSMALAAGTSKIGDANAYAKDGLPIFDKAGVCFEKGLKDEESSIGYLKATLENGIGAWNAFAKIHGEILENTHGPIEVLLRVGGSGGEFGLRSAGNNSFPCSIIESGEWTVLKMPESLVTEARNNYEKGMTYPIEIVSKEAKGIGESFDISDVYENSGFDLSEYNTIDNKRGTWAATFQGLTMLSANWSFSAHPWLSSAKNPENLGYAMMSALSQKNETGSEIETSGNEVFGQIPFYPNYVKTLDAEEVFLLIHSTEEVNLRYAKVGDIVRNNSAPSADSVLLTDKLYKGWNKVGIKTEAINGVSFVADRAWVGIVPEKWSTTITITTLGLFYR